jgi:hypothetical protein
MGENFGPPPSRCRIRYVAHKSDHGDEQPMLPIVGCFAIWVALIEMWTKVAAWEALGRTDVLNPGTRQCSSALSARRFFGSVSPKTTTLANMSNSPFHDVAALFCPEDVRAMTTAFEGLVAKLAVNKRPDDEAEHAAEVIASEIIALSAAGEHDPELLCAGVLESLRQYGEAINPSKKRSDM